MYVSINIFDICTLEAIIAEKLLQEAIIAKYSAS